MQQAKRVPANNDIPVMRFISAFSWVQVFFDRRARNITKHGVYSNPLGDVSKLPAYADHGFTSITRTPLIRYWELLAVATAIICVTTGWPDHDKEGRFELVWKQAAHWTAIIVAMKIVLLPDIQTMYTGPATGYTLLLLLALGTFLAGLNISFQLCALGVAMAIAVPAMLWLKQTALLAFLIVAAIVGIGVAFWRR